jgi:plastocyanin
MSTTPLTGTLVVCVAAAGIAAGALFIEAGDTSSPAPAATASPSPTDQTTGGGYGSPGSPAAGGDAAAGEPAALEISGFQFAATAAGAGSQVTVVNRDAAPHTVTADDGAFDSGQVDGGTSLTFAAPTQPGTYTFACGIHPEMRGTLTVR